MEAGELQTIISALASGGLVTVLATAYLRRALKDLEDAVKEVGVLHQKLAIMAVKLESAESGAQLLLEHDRKIAAMEQVIYGNNWAPKAFRTPDQRGGQESQSASDRGRGHH